MIFRYVTVAVLATLTVPVSAAHATLIDFNELKKPRGETYIYGAYTDPTGDYRLSADRCSASNNGPTCFITTVNKGRGNIDFDATQTGLGNFLGSSVATLNRVDGAAFLLGEITFAPAYGNSSGYSQPEVGITFTFNFADGSGSKSEAVLIPNTAGQWVTKTTFDFADYGLLSSFSWKPGTASSGFIQVDNINVSLPAAAAVPEPATWAMMLGGFGLIGGTMRKTRRRTGAIRFA